MPDLIPYSEMPRFIPLRDDDERPAFAACAAMFAYGEVDAVLIELIREGVIARLAAPAIQPAQHTTHPAAALGNAAANA